MSTEQYNFNIQDAIRNRNLENVATLLRQRENEISIYCLVLAITTQNLDIVKMLLSIKHFKNDLVLSNALSYSVEIKNVAITYFILQKCIFIDPKILTKAVTSQNLDIVKLFINDYRIPESYFYECANYAASLENFEIFKLFQPYWTELTTKFATTVKNLRALSLCFTIDTGAIDTAVENKLFDCIDFLCDYFYSSEILTVASEKGKTIVVKYLIRQGVYPSRYDYLVAIKNGHKTTGKYIWNVLQDDLLAIKQHN